VILYAGFAAIVTLLFLTGQLGSFIAGAGIPAYRADLAAFLVILGAGLGAWVGGGSKQGILIVGTIGAFIVLTAHQELAMVRYMSLAGILFAIGIYGLTVSRNAVRMLMSIELMINAANINFVTFARYVDPSELRGQLFAIFVLTVAAAEAAVGLAIVLAIYRNMATVDMERFNLLKW
jgi:NAD(P)H-quinone oxidoreductase subunit 4L